MKITIEIPDIKLMEYDLEELLKKSGVITEEYKDWWTNGMKFEDNKYTLKLEGVVEGELTEKLFTATTEEVCKYLLESINHFEYEGRYGTKMELTSENEPSFTFYRNEGNLKTFLEDVIKESFSASGYSYGYCE